MIEITSGQIIVDNVSLEEMPLDLCRAKIAAVPQEGLVLPGSVRYNLDPLEQYSDEQIRSAITSVGLQFNDLDVDLSSTGLSHGQTQLLALARALLRKCRVVVLDEALSHVDPKTEEKVMNVLQEKFDGCTVLAVMHKLDSLPLFDQVLVLDRGRAIFTGTPAEANAAGYALE
jgi:ABC-type multidrug transport system fused ATPase/permease subunit